MKMDSANATIEADILILGGGCSGWSLVAALLELNLQTDYKIAVVEKPQGKLNKTWSFWESLPKSTIWETDAKWNSLRFNLDPSFSTSLDEEHVYQSVKATNFINTVKKRAEDTGKIQLIDDQIIDYDYKTSSAFGKQNNYKAKVVFQNFFISNKEEIEAKKKLDYPLLQHFKGLVIESESLDLRTNEALFMDFEVNQTFGFAFMYVLPYSKTKALFEYTLFSENVLEKEQYEEQIYAYLAAKHHLNKSDISILEEEFGVIPMNDMLPSVQNTSNWFKMGSYAGMTKASTGYTFARIQKASNAAAASIKEFGLNDLQALKNQLEKGTSSTRYRVYDIILLELLKNYPNEVIKAFRQLFKKLGIKKMLQFLSEDQNLIADFFVLNSVDKWVFIKAIWRAKKTLSRHLLT
jgi:lycopene beta-cyclase